jgi:Arc/MetJ family transcription regulator
MPPRSRRNRRVPERVRKSIQVDAAKLERARKALGLTSDAEVLRVALDHLLRHHPSGGEEEE